MVDRPHLPKPFDYGGRNLLKVARLTASILAVELKHGTNPNFYLWETPNQTDEPLPHWWADVQMAYTILLVSLIGFSIVCANTRTHKNPAAQELNNEIVVNLRWRGFSVHTVCAMAVGLIFLQIMGTSLVYSRRFVYEPYTGPGLWLGAVVGMLSLIEETKLPSQQTQSKTTSVILLS